MLTWLLALGSRHTCTEEGGTFFWNTDMTLWLKIPLTVLLGILVLAVLTGALWIAVSLIFSGIEDHRRRY